jgi:hypothetical protein
LLIHYSTKGIQMQKHSNVTTSAAPTQSLSKIAIIVTALFVGGSGLYAGMVMGEQSQADAKVPARASSAAAPAALNAQQLAAVGQVAVKASVSKAAVTPNTAPNEASSKTSAHAHTHAGATALIQPRTNSSAASLSDMLNKMEMPADFVPTSANGSTENAPFERIHLAEISAGQQAIKALGSNLSAVADWYGMSADDLRSRFLNDQSLYVDRKGRMLNVDDGIDGSNTTLNSIVNGATANAATATAVTVTQQTPFPLDQTFALHSRAGASRVLYLNFKGLGNYPAFSLDKVPSTFSDAEKTMIQNIFLRVKEDYAAFDVDITTEAPTSVVGKTGAMILITPQTSTAGGYAYLGSFTKLQITNPIAFCFPNNLANAEKPIAECISHELGHTLGLNHQGTNTVGYYTGHGDGETGWAPIMGVGYYKNLTQWSKGEYANANNKEDAYNVMLARGLPTRVDDHGNSLAFASAMTSVVSNGFNNLSTAGVIASPSDVDVHSFSAGAGDVSFTLSVPAGVSNLDAAMSLIDSTGKVLATSNNASALGTTLTAKLTGSATYYLSITGAGKGDPKTTGYSNYGSIGQYTIVGKSAVTFAGAPTIAIKPSLTSAKPGVTITFGVSIVTAPQARVVSYEMNFGDGTKAAANSSATSLNLQRAYAKAGTYEAVLKVTDSRGLVSYKGVVITIN